MSEMLCNLFYYDKNDEYTNEMFEKMWKHNNKELIYTMFYLRKNRGYGAKGRKKFYGRGERKIFQQFIIWMSYNHLEILSKLIPHVPNYGYWKDLLVLMATPAEKYVIKLYAEQLKIDYQSYNSENRGLISLACKWTPNEKSSNDIKHGTFGKIARCMGITKKELRKIYLVPMRKYLPVTEQLISDKKWNLINYEYVPKVCLEKNRKIFKKYDEEKFSRFEKKFSEEPFLYFNLPNLLRELVSGKNPCVDISCETYFKQQATIVALDVSRSMIDFESFIAISLLSEMIGVTSWLPYNFYGLGNNYSNNLEEISYEKRYLEIMETIEEVRKKEHIEDFSLNIRSCVDEAIKRNKKKLIILSSLGVDRSEIDFSDNDLEIIYWCINYSAVNVTNDCIITGYHQQIYKNIIKCKSFDRQSYRHNILKEILKDHII